MWDKLACFCPGVLELKGICHHPQPVSYILVSKKTGVACRIARQVKELDVESHDLSSPMMKRQN